MDAETKHTPWMRDGCTVYALGDDGCNLWSFHVQTYRGLDVEHVAIQAAAAPALVDALRNDVEQSDEALRSFAVGLIGESTLLSVIKMMGKRARKALRDAGVGT